MKGQGNLKCSLVRIMGRDVFHKDWEKIIRNDLGVNCSERSLL